MFPLGCCHPVHVSSKGQKDNHVGSPPSTPLVVRLVKKPLNCQASLTTSSGGGLCSAWHTKCLLSFSLVPLFFFLALRVICDPRRPWVDLGLTFNLSKASCVGNCSFLFPGWWSSFKILIRKNNMVNAGCLIVTGQVKNLHLDWTDYVNVCTLTLY